MNEIETPVRIYVGTDRSQMIGVKVLEHSIRRHSSLPIELRTLIDIVLPEPEDPRLRQRTGFSFARFAIPALAGRVGRAIYMDADMLVFRDISELWSLPFSGAKVVCQEESAKIHGGRRVPQCSVMLLDCASLDWDAEAIVRGLGAQYDYPQLMQELCILQPEEIAFHMPARWNSLEHYDETTALLHYTDMPSQPWVSPDNRNGWLWTREVQRMLTSGALHMEELEEERARGYLRPSFFEELKREATGPASSAERATYAKIDRAAGFKPHEEVMAAYHHLQNAIRAAGSERRFNLLARARAATRRVLGYH